LFDLKLAQEKTQSGPFIMKSVIEQNIYSHQPLRLYIGLVELKFG